MNTYNTVAAEVQIADNAAVAAPAHIMFFWAQKIGAGIDFKY